MEIFLFFNVDPWHLWMCGMILKLLINLTRPLEPELSCWLQQTLGKENCRSLCTFTLLRLASNCLRVLALWHFMWLSGKLCRSLCTLVPFSQWQGTWTSECKTGRGPWPEILSVQSFPDRVPCIRVDFSSPYIQLYTNGLMLKLMHPFVASI